MGFEAYLGKTESRSDIVLPVMAQALAATVDVAVPARVLPALWHWTLFQDWLPPAALGPDGHPKRGGFLPPLHDLPRRMWAGGRVSFPGDLWVGDSVTRTSTIARIEEKDGGSGRLVFVTVRHEISSPRGLAISEEQDIVYRGTSGAAVKDAAPSPPPPQGAWTRLVQGDPLLLFRYSALTGNSHRIHYDLEYVKGVEGYPGLLVHGPLQATWLADMVGRGVPGARIAQFSYRGQRPAFHMKPMTLLGWIDCGAIRLESRDHTGAVCMAARAELAAV
jgi:hydroxyacyl-ACP dehydratase HTD2-like protein with hotdog domain